MCKMEPLLYVGLRSVEVGQGKVSLGSWNRIQSGGNGSAERTDETESFDSVTVSGCQELWSSNSRS